MRQLGHLLVLVVYLNRIVVLYLEASINTCTLLVSLQRSDSKTRPLWPKATQVCGFVDSCDVDFAFPFGIYMIATITRLVCFPFSLRRALRLRARASLSVAIAYFGSSRLTVGPILFPTVRRDLCP